MNVSVMHRLPILLEYFVVFVLVFAMFRKLSVVCFVYVCVCGGGGVEISNLSLNLKTIQTQLLVLISELPSLNLDK